MPNALIMIAPEQKMDLLISLCKRRGFIYPGSEIYGGFANSWDYGPYGAQLKKNIRDAWWKMFVEMRGDVVGIESPIIMNPKVWQASGHLDTFTDPLVDCKRCKHRFRADHLLEAAGREATSKDISGIVCPDCGGELTEIRNFNLMYKTFVGVTEDASSVAYLRPETAGGMFVAWKNVRDSLHRRLPLGIAQIGKSFRNEITPGNFIFRTREFDIMEIEYFVKPSNAPAMFESWLADMKRWCLEVLKIKPENLVYHEIPKEELAHYSTRTMDIEYQYPFGLKELYGLANRTDFDLSRHQEASGENLQYMDPETNEKFIPHVIEPTWGLDRTVLVTLLEHFDVDEASSAEGEKEPRTVLRFPPKLAPIKVAVLPLTKKDGLPELAQKIVENLRQHGITTEYDTSASIGKRYRRQDEIGTPWCMTVDMETLNDNAVTIRDRDTMEQIRIQIKDVVVWMIKKLD